MSDAPRLLEISLRVVDGEESVSPREFHDYGGVLLVIHPRDPDNLDRKSGQAIRPISLCGHSIGYTDLVETHEEVSVTVEMLSTTPVRFSGCFPEIDGRGIPVKSFSIVFPCGGITLLTLRFYPHQVVWT